MSNQVKSIILLLYLIQTPFDGGGFELYQQAISSLIILSFWFIKLILDDRTSEPVFIQLPVNFIFLLIFILFTGFSIIGSVNKATSNWVFIYWLNHILFFLAVFTHFRDLEIFKKIIERILLPFSGIVSLWGLYHFLAGNFNLSDPLWSANRAQAMFEQPNSLGGYLSVIIILIFILYLREVDKKRSVIVYSLLLLSVTAFIASLSRGSWITLIICIVLYIIIISKGYLKSRIKHIFLLVLGIAMIFLLMSIRSDSQVVSRAKSIVESNYHPDNLLSRMDIWSAGWHLALDNPFFGTGIGTYHLTYLSKSKLDWDSQIWMAHNDYIQFISEIGFPGTFALLSFGFFYIYSGWHLVIKFRKNNNILTSRQNLIIGIYVASLSPLIHSLVDFDLRSSGVFALFLFLSSYVLYEIEKHDLNIAHKYNTSIHLRVNKILKVSFLLFFTLILFFEGTTVLADYRYKEALKKENMGRYAEGIDLAKKAVQLKPGVSDYHEFLARNYMRYVLAGDNKKVRDESAYESEKEYLLAIKNSRTLPEYYLGLAKLYENKRNLFEPVRLKIENLYYKAISASPSSNFLRFYFAEVLMKVGSYKSAISSLESTRGHGRPLINGFTLLAEAYRLNGEREKANSTVDLKLAETPDDGFANFIKAEILEDMSRLNDAIPHYLLALKGSDETNRFQVLLRLGNSYNTIGEYDSALIYLREALELREGEKNILLLMSQTYGAMGNLQQAEKYFKMAIRQESGD